MKTRKQKVEKVRDQVLEKLNKNDITPHEETWKTNEDICMLWISTPHSSGVIFIIPTRKDNGNLDVVVSTSQPVTTVNPEKEIPEFLLESHVNHFK